MAIMNISTWDGVGDDDGQQVPFLDGFRTSQNVLFFAATPGRNSTPLGSQDKFIRILVDGAGYIKFGDITVVAAIGDIYVEPGESLVVMRNKKNGFTHISAVS